jgi:hypothetical protein
MEETLADACEQAQGKMKALVMPTKGVGGSPKKLHDPPSLTCSVSTQPIK